MPLSHAARIESPSLVRTVGLRLVALLVAASAGACVAEEEPCPIGTARCDGNTVQYCLGPIDDGTWVSDHTCTGGSACTEQGCPKSGPEACCVGP